MNEYSAADDPTGGMTGDGLRSALAAGAAFVTPGPAPADAVLAGASRRTVRARMAGTAAGVVAVGMVGAAVAVGGHIGGGHTGPGLSAATGTSATPTSSATLSAPEAAFTQFTGLAPGLSAPPDSFGPFHGDLHTVLLSGTVNGVPWWLQGVDVENPSPTDKYWHMFVDGQSGHSFCTALRTTVGTELNAGGGVCSPAPDRGPVSEIEVVVAGGTLNGVPGFTGFARVPSATAKVVWDFGGGRTATYTPVVTAYGQSPFVVFPFLTGDAGTITAYDAAGHRLTSVSERSIPSLTGVPSTQAH